MSLVLLSSTLRDSFINVGGVFVYMDYAAMLSKAQEEMPDSVQERERYEIPKVKGHLEGNKTIISNLRQIAQKLRRDDDQLFRFLLKELAAPGARQGSRYVFGAKISASKINSKVKKYASEFVLCKECGKPETDMAKDGNVVYVQCRACNSKYPVKVRL